MSEKMVLAIGTAPGDRYYMESSVFTGIDQRDDTRGKARMVTRGATKQAKVQVPTRRIFIEGEAIGVVDELVPLKDVRLDPSNPRIQHAVRQKFNGKTPTQKELVELIYSTSGVPDLFKSIRDSGGLQDPIHILANGTVAEGNCRAACFMRLADLQTADARWKAIQCIRLPPTVTPRQVSVLQAQFHVAGKIKWRAAEKAGHIHSMHKHLNMDAKAIASAMGMHEKTIKRLLDAYNLWVTEIVPNATGKEALRLWSHAEEYFKNSELDDHRADPRNAAWFAKQVVSGKIKRGDEVRKLPKIVKNKAAIRALETGGVKKAISVVSKKDPTIDSTILKRIKETTELLTHACR
jgi:hypothetical protein